MAKDRHHFKFEEEEDHENSRVIRRRAAALREEIANDLDILERIVCLNCAQPQDSCSCNEDASAKEGG